MAASALGPGADGRFKRRGGRADLRRARLRGDIDTLLSELDPHVEWRPHLTALGGGPGPRPQRRGRASGVELHLQVAHLLRFKDGKCVENTTYLDRDEALSEAGLR